LYLYFYLEFEKLPLTGIKSIFGANIVIHFQKNVELQERIIFEDGLTPDVADRLVCLIRTRQWLFKTNYSFRSRTRYKQKTNMDEILQHEFYILARLIIQLELVKEAADPDAMCKEIGRISNTLKEHISQFKLPEHVQQEILHLCRQLPERALRKYDNIYFDKNCV
jgi:hypothetical protein